MKTLHISITYTWLTKITLSALNSKYDTYQSFFELKVSFLLKLIYKEFDLIILVQYSSSLICFPNISNVFHLLPSQHKSSCPFFSNLPAHHLTIFFQVNSSFCFYVLILYQGTLGFSLAYANLSFCPQLQILFSYHQLVFYF